MLTFLGGLCAIILMMILCVPLLIAFALICVALVLILKWSLGE